MAFANPSALTFTVAGPEEERVVLEWSTNLLAWEISSTNQLEGSTSPIVIDAPRFPWQTFYRARRWEPPLNCPTSLCFELLSTNSTTCPVYGPADLPANRDASIPTSATPIKTLRLMIQVLADDNGNNPVVTPEAVDQQVARLNAHFLPGRIQFVHSWRVVSSNEFRRVETADQALAMRRALSLNPATQHNVFVAEAPLEFLGLSTFPWETNALTETGGTFVNSRRFGGSEVTLTHELGHAFGLWHTHHGMEVVPSCSVCWERADGLNADTTGDRCSDTPPTRIDGNGNIVGAVDFCSSAAWPSNGLFNFMAGAPGAGGGGFTRQQAGRMHGWITNRLSGWLDFDTPPAPSDFRVVANLFGEVQLFWTDNAANETAYRIERSIAGGSFSLIASMTADASDFMDNTAPPLASVLYRVQAVNGGLVSYFALSAAVLTGPAPRVLYLDAAYTGSADGTPEHPFPTLPPAYGAASGPAILRFQPGRYTADFPLNKVLRLEPAGGPVLIERP